MSSALLSTRNLPAVVDQSVPETGRNGSKNSRQGKRKQRRYVQPPDKGWGWVVVLAALGCSAIVDGLIFSFSSLFGILLDDARISFPVIVACIAAQIFSYLFIGELLFMIAIVFRKTLNLFRADNQSISKAKFMSPFCLLWDVVCSFWISRDFGHN